MSEKTFQLTEDKKISPTIYKTSIDGLFYVPHKTFTDERGFYSELTRIPEVEEVTGQKFITKQINQSMSKQNVARGIHSEDWNKLITITSGVCYCALVDLRPESSTFGKYESFYLGINKESSNAELENIQPLTGSLFVSKGIGNSFCVMQGPMDYIYAVDVVWSQRNIAGDTAIALFDEDINIQWPIAKDKMIFSKRDTDGISLRKAFPEKF